MLPLLYDTRLRPTGIGFVLFGVWTVHTLKFSNIKFVKELHGLKLGPFNAYNFKNRLGGQAFLIETRTGWFTKRVLVTPGDPEEFISALRTSGVELT
jgi:hypothetical protein